MKLCNKLLFLLMLFVISINYVKADECDKDYILEMKELANNINYDYEYIGDDLSPQLYKVSFEEIDSRLYIKYSSSINDDIIITENKNNNIEVNSGNYVFRVYSTMCSGVLLTIKLDLPKFNEYSSNPECDHLKDELDICSEWYIGELNDEKFDEIINNYEKEIEQSKTTFNDYFLNNIYYFVGGGILLVIIIIILIYFKRKNSYLT